MPSLPVTAKRELCAHMHACRYLEQARFEQMSGQMPCLQGSDSDAKQCDCIYRALPAGNGKQHLDIQMPSLLGFWTEAFCASVYPDALLASFGKHRIIGQSSAAARLTTAQPGRAFRIILPGLLFRKTA